MSEEYRQSGRRQAGRTVVLVTELRRLWLGWRGPLLLLVFSLFLSVYVLLLAADPEINVLSQRKMLDQTIQVTVLVGILAVLLLGADSFSGERDQRSLESLLLTPVARGQLVRGKLLAIMTLWPAMIPVAVPYIALVARGTGLTPAAVLLLLLPGTMLVGLCATLAVLVSSFAPTNLVSFAVNFLVILLLAAPTQLPGSVSALPQVHWLVVVNPFTAVADYQSTLLDGGAWSTGLDRLLSPVIALTLLAGFGPGLLDRRLSLEGGFQP